MIIFLILPAIIPVKCLYVDQQHGVDANTNGKHDELFIDSLIPGINARKKDELSLRRDLSNDEFPSAMENSVKNAITELRRRSRRNFHSHRRVQRAVANRAQDFTGKATGHGTSNRRVKRGHIKNNKIKDIITTPQPDDKKEKENDDEELGRKDERKHTKNHLETVFKNEKIDENTLSKENSSIKSETENGKLNRRIKEGGTKSSHSLRESGTELFYLENLKKEKEYTQKRLQELNELINAHENTSNGTEDIKNDTQLGDIKINTEPESARKNKKEPDDNIENILKNKNIVEDTSSKENNLIEKEDFNKGDHLNFDLELDSDEAIKYAVPIDVKINGYLQIPENKE